MKQIYSIDSDGYINEIKTLLDHYVLNENDFIGGAPFPKNHHYVTGLEKPKTQEQLNANEIQELNQWLDLRRNVETPEKAVKQARLLELLR